MAAVLGLFLLQYILRLITDVPDGLSGFYVKMLSILTVTDFLIAVGLVICAVQILSPVPPSSENDGKSVLTQIACRAAVLPWPVAILASIAVLAGGLANLAPDLTWRALLCPTSTAFGLWSFSAAIVARFWHDEVHLDNMIAICLVAVVAYGGIQFTQFVVVLDAAGQSFLDGRSFETVGMILSLAAKFALALSLAFLRDEQYIVLIRSIPQGRDLSGLFVEGWPRVVREAAQTVQASMEKMVRDTFHQLGNLKIVIGAIDRLEEERQIEPDLLQRLRYANSLYTSYLLAIACYDQRLGRFKASEFDLVQTIRTVLASFDTFDPATISRIYEADNVTALTGFDQTRGEGRASAY